MTNRKRLISRAFLKGFADGFTSPSFLIVPHKSHSAVYASHIEDTWARIGLCIEDAMKAEAREQQGWGRSLEKGRRRHTQNEHIAA